MHRWAPVKRSMLAYGDKKRTSMHRLHSIVKPCTWKGDKPMNLNDVETQVRQDLFDPNATRWANSDIDRAIDKAVDRYSHYYPNIACTDMGTHPYQQIYPYHTSPTANYPVL